MTGVDGYVSSHLAGIIANEETILPEFLFLMLCQIDARLLTEGGYPSLKTSVIENIEIPLPPLSIQQQIVNEIEGYQKIIDGASMVVNNYKPHIAINPDWEMVEIKELCELVQYGLSEKMNTEGNGYKCFRMNELIEGLAFDNGKMKRSPINEKDFLKYKLEKGDLLFNRTNSFEHVGRTGIFNLVGDYCFASYLIRLKINRAKANPFFVNQFMNTDSFQKGIKLSASRAIGQANINAQSLQQYLIPLPSLEEQNEIVSRIEHEQQLVNASKQLITLYQQKIKNKIAEVWGEKKEPLAYEENNSLSLAAEE